jgi:transcriptional regulator with XRE-family HTH domain
MKEAFKIGGYAWHAHKRFEEIKNGWSFNKTVEWLDSIGIRFAVRTIRNFSNVYSTFRNNSQLVANSLRESYAVVNKQADEVVGMPDSKAEIINRIFTALPSDDSTNPKELIRELIRAGKVFAVTERTIQRWKPEAMKQKRLSQEEVQKIQELREEGKTQREIAEELDINQATVSRNMQKENFPSASSGSASNVIPAPVSFQRPEPVDDYDDDEEDLDIEDSDDSTNLEWFTHPGLIPFLIPLLIPDN